ncbi:BMP family ABC transporter substrate-binding protein (plasmid) [Rhizobium sp. TRM96647]|uniref:BMP family lipoprotein n=1 Tax=unclassified Rhizobium TaxID=2613769 RepID=UPI0021E7DCD2|nr:MULTISPECIES: BMP family ABC transporter substrate-binding protein [unclassified Rhizobium]MCV3735165.1 BMP family ABC transporter substrate-binding protein [Rhizobium sp. TRM96647]MCV3758071.1 BMP family ABC transporter substrate-binding protein [Rhizobium sp. TRM96650]
MKSRTGLRFAVTSAVSTLLLMSPLAHAQDAGAPFTIGIILEARPDVEPWSAAWHDAAEKLKSQDPTIKVLESYDAYDPARAEPVARQMLDSGANILALTTFVLSDVAKTVAADYPEVPMAVASFGVSLDPNLSSFTASYLEMGYSNCWLLTKLSKDGRIGVVGAQQAPFETEQMEGCKLGAAAANPASEIVLVNTNSFTDTQANREQVKGLLDKGITEINLLSGTEDALGGLRLCETSKANCVTWGGDARKWAPESTVTTVVLDWSVILSDQIAQARAGKPEVKVYNLTYGNGGLKVPDFDDTSVVTPELQKEFAAMIADLASEKIKLPESKAHPGLR